ncbi:MAG: EAL domain-containing protein [Pseudomonadota bacterium]
MAASDTFIDRLTMTSIEFTGDSAEEREAMLQAAAPARVMLIVRDREAGHWAPRWLRNAGLEVVLPDDPRHAIADVTSEQPDIVVIDAGLKNAEGQPVYASLAADNAPRPIVFALCKTRRETHAALKARNVDVLRKPHDWEMIARRVAHTGDKIVLERRLAFAEKSLRDAQKFADDARMQLKSRDSFEPVTGLPNRARFKDIVKRSMAAVERDDNKLAVVVAGFSRFRLVVEAMGQQAADQVLLEIGDSLSTCLKEAGETPVQARGLRTSMVGILDHARFGIMLTWSGDDDELARFQQRLMQALARPIQVGGQTVYLSACLGIAMYPDDADNVDSLLQRADNAMRAAQGRGGGVRYHCAESDAAAVRKLEIEHLLHEALDTNELSLAYQPVVDMASGDIIAVEALLRWHRPDGTSIAPDQFIGIAEESGLIVRVGDFVLDQVCRQYNRWRVAGLDCPVLCVNVARGQITDPEFPDRVQAILKAHQVPASVIELEISERGALQGDYEVINQLDRLKAIGVRLSIDDFGTGDSAISYIKDLPADVIKIDRGYIEGMLGNRKDLAITSAMVALGQRLDMLVIAEGVETEAQRDALIELGCQACQGFFYARPATPADFAEMLKMGLPAPTDADV